MCYSWKLNESLLREESMLKALRETIDEFEITHLTDPTKLPIKWKNFKSVLLGKMNPTRIKTEEGKTKSNIYVIEGYLCPRAMP